jgi:hypothetical protein
MRILQLAPLTFALGLFTSAACTHTLVYRESAGGKSETHTYTIAARGNGYRIDLIRQGDGTPIIDQCETDASLSTLRWRHQNPAQGTDVSAHRDGDTIHLAGTHEHKHIAKTFRAGGGAWKQLFSVDFQSFAWLGRTTARFVSIGTAGIGQMKMADFSVEVKEDLEIVVNGKAEQAVRIRVSPAGMRSVFWHGDYWLRKSDGRYLKYVGSRGLFAGQMVKELVRED